MSAASALRERGHELTVIGDRSVEGSLAGLGMKTEVLPPELDLGPTLGGALREAMAVADGDLAAAGPIVRERMKAWADDLAGPIARAVTSQRADVLLTSFFGVEAVHNADPQCPWVVVNSTFYVGPEPRRLLHLGWES